MRCFYHPEKEALGICKNCNRGICEDCLVDVDHHGLACKNTCQEEVREIQALIERNKTSYQRVSRIHYRNAFTFGCFSALLLVMFIAAGVQQGSFVTMPVLIIGFLWLFFMVGCIVNVINGRRLVKGTNVIPTKS